MDHSMAFLIDRCGKSYYSLSYKCPRARALPLSNNEASPSPIVASSASTAGSGPGTSTRRPKKSVVSITTWYPRTAVYTLKPTPSSQVSRYSAAASVTPSTALASTLLCVPLLASALLATSR
ncbi:hypothetical protein HPB50_021537 [Hyalomma asiaticum]|uniref:Uncharacterized protein n=1 Tax=Hyalomma asiaticum TaxID=266040 RepID=A0ACB7RKC9_HYAAI|nr:hypothetical protein HPB50_021537 [Hyalomma asiaticum]